MLMTQRNLAIAHEAGLWLQSKSAAWALDRLILFVFITACEALATTNGDSIHSIQKYITKVSQLFTQNPNICLELILTMLVSINWQYIGLKHPTK